MMLGLSQALPSLVEAKFKAAKASSSLVFSPSELAIIRTSTAIPFQLRFCPSLAKKPGAKPAERSTKPRIDPFDSPPSDLHIVDIPTANPTHLLVLNKFPIIAEHFILATKANKKQTHLLEQDDLEVTYACLKAWQESGDAQKKRLFAFFNSGEHSGASQPHRHLQFLPVESMRDSDVASSWDLLIELVLSEQDGRAGARDIPFTYFAHRLGSQPSGADLLRAYHELYASAKAAVTDYATVDRSVLHDTWEGDSPFSYNLAMTTSGMAILPRRAEGTMLRADNGDGIGFVALNGTTLGGTLMVKNQAEWDHLRTKPVALDAILTAIGVPQSHNRARSHV